jgi:hypothetical protein
MYTLYLRFSMLFIVCLFTLKGQILLNEGFTATFTPASAGWNVQNLSASPNPTLDWFQGNSASTFSAYNGNPDDYLAVNFNCTSDQNNAVTLSCWLITPTLTLVNGATLEFFTRTTANPASFPDRLDVHMSAAGNGTNVGNGPTTLGTFSTLLVSINPSLTTTGYPGTWTGYTVTVSGMPVATVGRIGFRYYVTGGGPAGLNSDYIGLDAVKYTLPCSQPSINITASAPGVCSGNSVSLTASASGSVGVSSYTWAGGQTTSAIVVSPTATTIYTVSGTSTAGCVGTKTTQITVTLTPQLSGQNYTVCAGSSVTLTASSPAVSYSWSTGSTASAIAVTANSSTVITLTAFGGAANTCPASISNSIATGAFLSISVNSSSSTVCSGRTVTLTATGAATQYSWSTGATSPVITVTPNTTTTYSVGGMSGMCFGGNSITVNVLPSPTLAIAQNPNTVCSGKNLTVTSSGASTYTYVLGAGASTLNPIALIAPTVTSLTTVQFTIGGTGSNGCVSAGIYTLAVNPNPTVSVSASSPSVCVGSSATLSASGADTYQWTGSGSSSSNPFVYTATSSGVQQFTATGTTSAGCTGTASISFTANNCNLVGIAALASNPIQVFPNPFQNELHIDGHEGYVKVINTLGQIVFYESFHRALNINTENWSKGAYTIQILGASREVLHSNSVIKP